MQVEDDDDRKILAPQAEHVQRGKYRIKILRLKRWDVHVDDDSSAAVTMMHGIFRGKVRSGNCLGWKEGKAGDHAVSNSVCTLMYAYVLLRT